MYILEVIVVNISRSVIFSNEHSILFFSCLFVNCCLKGITSFIFLTHIILCLTHWYFSAGLRVG